MSWVRYGDEFATDRRWDGVPYEARWHYVAVVAECSRSERYDCVIPLLLAHRASDVPDPKAATAALVAAGFVVIEGDDLVILDGEADHMPPESLRERKRKASGRERTRRWRQRLCDKGEHSEHCPMSCPRRSGDGSGDASPQDGTGQDRPATEASSSGREGRSEGLPPEALTRFLPRSTEERGVI